MNGVHVSECSWVTVVSFKCRHAYVSVKRQELACQWERRSTKSTITIIIIIRQIQWPFLKDFKKSVVIIQNNSINHSIMLTWSHDYICAYACMCVHLSDNLFVCVCLWICACMHVCLNVCTCMHVCTYMHMCVYECVHMYACVCLWVCACMHMCVWECVHMHVCICECVHMQVSVSV